MDEPIIGRDRELAVLDAAMDDNFRWATAVVLVGPAGAGKTTLWRAAVEGARARGRRVLEASPARAEARLSYAALGDLLSTLDDTAWAPLPGPQRRAFDVALLRTDPGGQAAEPRAVAIGLVTLLRSIVPDNAPLVVAIDDAQWLDRPSSAAIAYALRRLADVPLVVLASLRTELDEARPALMDAMAAWPVREIAVGPLSVGAVFELLRLRAGIRLSRPQLLRVHRASGGNPYLALEIGRALRDQPAGSTERLPLPATVVAATRRRLDALSAHARDLLLAASALPEPDPETLTRLIGGDDGAQAAFDEVVAAGILVVTGGRVRFTHPLLAETAYVTAASVERRRLHERLAVLARNPEERARHLAAASVGPSESVAAALDRGSAAARDRGAPDVAAELAERALGLTPPGRPVDLHARRIRAARAHFEAGDPASAVALLTATPDGADPGRTPAPGTPDGEREAERLVALAEVNAQASGVTSGLPMYEQALALTRDASLRSRVNADLASAYADAFDLGRARSHADRAVGAAREVGRREVLLRAIAVAAYVATITGDPAADALLREGTALERSRESCRDPRSVRFVAALRALYEDRIEDARRTMRDLAQEAEAAGTVTTQSFLAYSSLIERRAGHFALALALADQSHDVALQAGREAAVPLALHLRAQALAHLGRAGEARAVAEQVHMYAASTGQQYRLGLVDRGMLGFLALSEGDARSAFAILDPAADALASRDPGEPSLFTFLPDAIEAAVETGHIDRALVLLERLETPAKQLGRGWALQAASRCHGLIHVAVGDDDLAAAAFEEALLVHAGTAVSPPVRAGQGAPRHRLAPTPPAREGGGPGVADTRGRRIPGDGGSPVAGPRARRGSQDRRPPVGEWRTHRDGGTDRRPRGRRTVEQGGRHRPGHQPEDGGLEPLQGLRKDRRLLADRTRHPRARPRIPRLQLTGPGSRHAPDHTSRLGPLRRKPRMMSGCSAGTHGLPSMVDRRPLLAPREDPMKRTVRAVVLAVAVMAMAVPTVSADGRDWETRTFTCDGERSLTVALPPSEYAHAIVPFHVVGSGSVLVPLVFTYDGDTFLSKPLGGRQTGLLTSCKYVDPEGAHIEITGLLTPAR